MVKWTELRAELEKSTGLSKNQLDRMITKATRKQEVSIQHDPATGNARILSDSDVVLLRSRAADLRANPPQVPQHLAAKPKAETAAGASAEDPNLGVDTLAESDGPPNTRKSLLNNKHDTNDEDDDPDDEPKKGKKSWGKWLLIGGLVLAGGLALMAFMRRRQTNQVAGGGGMAQGIPEAPAVDVPPPAGPVALLSPQEVEQFRAAGIPIPGGPVE